MGQLKTQKSPKNLQKVSFWDFVEIVIMAKYGLILLPLCFPGHPQSLV